MNYHMIDDEVTSALLQLRESPNESIASKSFRPISMYTSLSNIDKDRESMSSTLFNSSFDCSRTDSQTTNSFNISDNIYPLPKLVEKPRSPKHYLLPMIEVDIDTIKSYSFESIYPKTLTLIDIKEKNK